MGTSSVSTLFRVSSVSSADSVVVDLHRRQAAIAAALRAVVNEPTVRVDDLHERIERLTARLDRLEDKVEMYGETEEAPLSWPSAVAATDRLEVPPLTTSRANSPAYDVLLGPAVSRSSA
jgi:hypothetical protein